MKPNSSRQSFYRPRLHVAEVRARELKDVTVAANEDEIDVDDSDDDSDTIKIFPPVDRDVDNYLDE